MHRVVSSLIVLFFVTATVAASARPMEVAVFEANAYAEPSDDAMIVEVFIEGTELSASEEERDGWLRIRLASGAVAWMRAEDLKPHREAPTILRRPEPPPAPRPAPTYTQVYVKDLDHLAELVQRDEVVYPMAKDLVGSETLADVGGWGGIIGGSVLMLVGVSQLEYGDYSGYSYTEADNTGAYTLMGVGAAISLVGLVIYYAARPTRNDLLDVVNTWNGRHPDEPFTLQSH